MKRPGFNNLPDSGRDTVFLQEETNPEFMGILRQFAEYLYIKKKDPNAPSSKWMRYMHGINRISILMFLAAVIIILVKIIFFRRH